MSKPIPPHILRTVWDRVDVGPADECWPWTLAVCQAGYGRVQWGVDGVDGGTTAHRATWTATHGTIPDGFDVDHLCRNPPCCNPSHLRLLPAAVNRRQNGASIRTHCPAGHAYDEANTIRTADGHRLCRACRRARAAARRHAERDLRLRLRADRTCRTCGGPVAPQKRADTLYCSGRCQPQAVSA